MDKVSQEYTSGSRYVMHSNLRPDDARKKSTSVAYRNLNVCCSSSAKDYQKTFVNYPLSCLGALRRIFGKAQKPRGDILRCLEGLVSEGEVLLVLGRPESASTAFLKVLAGQHRGFQVGVDSILNYHGNDLGKIML